MFLGFTRLVETIAYFLLQILLTLTDYGMKICICFDAFLPAACERIIAPCLLLLPSNVKKKEVPCVSVCTVRNIISIMFAKLGVSRCQTIFMRYPVTRVRHN